MHATLSTLALLGAAALNGQVYAQSQTSNDMGPGAMMWPTDRPWTADADNIAPCGSPSGPGNRTDFPLSECILHESTCNVLEPRSYRRTDLQTNRG